MSILVYTSRQSAGGNPARERLINRIVQSYKETPFNGRAKIFVVTPKQDTYQVERELIDKIGDGGIFGLQVLDFERLLEKIVRESGTAPEVIDAHGRLMLMQKTLADVKEDLTVYNSSADKQGFAEQAVEQISELKRAQVSPDILETESERFTGTLLADKMKDLSRIFSAFSGYLGEERFDEDDFKGLALGLIAESELLKDAQIYFLDHSTVDYEQALFMILAHSQVQTLEMALICDENQSAPDMTAFSAARESLATLRRLAAESGTRLDVMNFPARGSKNALSTMASGLFSYLPPVYENNQEQIKLFEEKEPWDEVVKVAQLIAGENQNGTDYSKIAVMMTESETYENIIRRVFAQYRIPIFIDENHRVTDNHFIQSLLFALDAAESGFNRSDMLAYLKSDFSGLTSEQSDLIENYVIEAGIRPWEWKRPFRRLPGSWRKRQESLDDDHELNRIRKSVYENLSLLNRSGRKEADYNTHIQNLKRFLERTDSQERLLQLSEELASGQSQELALRYRQIWNILLELLDQMSSALGTMTASFSDFIKVLKTGLSSYEIGVIPEDQNAVIIANLERTKLPELESLYVVGVNEGKLPKSLSDNSLFTDYDKERLSGLFGLEESQIRGRQYQHKIEELSFYTAVTKPAKRLTLSYSAYDPEGTQLLPSRYIGVLEQMYGRSIALSPRKLFSLLTPSRAEALIESMDPERRISWQVRRIVREWFSLNPMHTLNLLPASLIKARGEDVLESHNAADLYHLPGEPMKVSASRLEQFAGCPFRHFLHYGLRPREREEYEVRALDTGILVHEVFDRFLENIRAQAGEDPERFREIVRNYAQNYYQLETDCSAVFDEVFNERDDAKRYEHSAASRYLVIKIKRIILTALQMMLNQLSESGYVPERMEQAFAEMTEAGLIVEGRIDRIDLPPREDEDGFPVRIVDYKTGAKRISYTDLYYGLSLQLALYLDEAVKAYEKDNPGKAYPGGAFYFLTDNATVTDPKTSNIRKEIQGNYKMVGLYNKSQESYIKDEVRRSTAKQSPGKLERSELETLLEHTRLQVQNLSERLLAGDIGIAPARIKGIEVGCNYCSYRDICRFDGKDKNCGARDMDVLEKDVFFGRLKLEEGGGSDE